MKKFLYAAILLLSATIVGCSEDTTYGSITLDHSAVYVGLEEYGAELYSSFTYSNIDEFEIYDTPLGWEAEVSYDSDTNTGMVTVYAPSRYYVGMDYTGDVIIQGTTNDETYTYAYLEVGMVDFIDLEATGQQANSMIVSEVGKVYLFNPNLRGESSVEASTKATDCVLLWRSVGSPITGVKMYDNKIGFFTSYDENDLDEDGDEEDLIPGNAVIAALSDQGAVIWSWHIWVTEFGIESTTINDVEFMNCNIGALGNSNADYEETLDSYGLYYQWGRKDPFIQPYYYNAAGAIDAYLYNDSGSVKYAYYQANSSTGFLGYSITNPGSYIGGTEESLNDWLLPAHQRDDLWGGDSAEKSIYDPSPRGWRVPSMAELAVLGEATEILVADDTRDLTDNDKDSYEYVYGATFDSNYFVAAGRRAYMNGSIQNYAPGELFKPWAGYYWSRDAAANDSDGYKTASALRFYLEGGDDGDGTIITETDSNYRAMGMQIRCVKY
ncbi:MAG: hypothetical protein SNF68_08190 [Rikenellaceae bacterium]